MRDARGIFAPLVPGDHFGTIIVTGGQGFTGRHVTQHQAAGVRRVISYNRDFATDEDVQSELFDVPRPAGY